VRVLVTGGAGFIGSAVADKLADAGHEVIVLDALVAEAHAAQPASTTQHERVIGDVGDATLVRTLLTGVDAVCHQAAAVGHGLNPSDAPMYAARNDLATAVLLAEMYAAGVKRLVLASSMVVYGEGRYECTAHGLVPARPRRVEDLNAGQFEPRCACGRVLAWRAVPESAPLQPRSIYAATKVAQEHLAGAWARQCGGEVWALRYHNVYGPGMPQNTPYAGVASIFRSALSAGQPPRVFEDGLQTRDFVHVSDVAVANLLALTAGQPADGFAAVNVCSGAPHTVLDFAATLAAAMGGPAPIVVGGARPADVRHIVASADTAARVLGFRAAVQFADGVAAFATDELRESAALTSGSAAGG
jgi:dTDP-L-rhamnose 4-epimerase